MDFRKEMANGVCKAVGRHMEYAQKLRASNDHGWWKVHEACLLAIIAIKDGLEELATASQLEFDLNAFFNQFVLASLHESSNQNR